VKKIILITLSLAILSGCATSPMGRSQLIMMSDNEMNAMGDKAFLSLVQKGPMVTDRQANAYVDCVATALTREVGGKWEVAVFKNQSANAFAVPGGKIGVNSGMLGVATNQDQLAAVIGHEVSHVLARHSNERMSQQSATKIGLGLIQAVASAKGYNSSTMMGVLGLGAQYGILLPYSRVQESEADLMGLDLMAKAGFNPTESVNLWINMSKASGGKQPAEFMSTHPSHDSRIQDLQNRMAHAMELSNKAHAAGKNPQCESLTRR
jgi:predicted Zn-dependent protease